MVLYDTLLYDVIKYAASRPYNQTIFLHDGLKKVLEDARTCDSITFLKKN